MPKPWQPRLWLFPSLYLKPQVRQIARSTGLHPDAVVGKLYRFWIDAQVRATAAGLLEGKSATWVDLLVDHAGFAAGMVEAGWLRVDPAGLVIPDFDDRISKKAVKRIEDALRKAGLREVERAGDDDHTADIRRHTATPGDKVPVAADRPKGRAAKTAKPDVPKGEAVTDPRFWRFWRAYPKQWNQPLAVEEWTKLAPDDALVEAILAAVEAQKQTPQWKENNGQYIPHPAKWLALRQWQNRVEPVGGGPVHRGSRVVARPGEYGTKPCFGEGEADPPEPPGQPGLFNA
jgi:hypothetical protein